MFLLRDAKPFRRTNRAVNVKQDQQPLVGVLFAHRTIVGGLRTQLLAASGFVVCVLKTCCDRRGQNIPLSVLQARRRVKIWPGGRADNRSPAELPGRQGRVAHGATYANLATWIHIVRLVTHNQVCRPLRIHALVTPQIQTRRATSTFNHTA
jgi:hypothetical protein